MNFAPHETAMYEIVAAMRFPGPNYYEVLRWLHEDLRPDSYVEIGVGRGHSLALAMPPTIAVGIDPCPQVDDCRRTETRVVAMPSSEFFAKHTLREFVGANHFSLAFVDGLHQFEQAVDDIFNLEVYAQPESVIAVHDTIPLDERSAGRTPRTTFHTGDVWKVVPFLRQFRPDLEVVTVRTGPSGLTLIRRLDGSRKKSQADTEAIGRFRELPWEYYSQHCKDSLHTVPNERGAVAGWLSRQGDVELIART